MIQHDKMTKFRYLSIVLLVINGLNAQISDKRLCADVECKEPVSQAKTLLRYSSPDSRILSFTPNVDVLIYSKSAGSRADLWGAEINGKRGYIPKHLVRETKILKKPTHLVDTEANYNEEVKVPLDVKDVKPDKVQEPHEVVDGTTVYLNSPDGPVSTESIYFDSSESSSTEHLSEDIKANLSPESAEVLESNEKEVNNEINKNDGPQTNAEESKKGTFPDTLDYISQWLGDHEEDGEDDTDDVETTKEDTNQNLTISEEPETTNNSKIIDQSDDSTISNVKDVPPLVSEKKLDPLPPALDNITINAVSENKTESSVNLDLEVKANEQSSQQLESNPQHEDGEVKNQVTENTIINLKNDENPEISITEATSVESSESSTEDILKIELTTPIPDQMDLDIPTIEVTTSSSAQLNLDSPKAESLASPPDPEQVDPLSVEASNENIQLYPDIKDVPSIVSENSNDQNVNQADSKLLVDSGFNLNSNEFVNEEAPVTEAVAEAVSNVLDFSQDNANTIIEIDSSVNDTNEKDNLEVEKSSALSDVHNDELVLNSNNDNISEATEPSEEESNGIFSNIFSFFTRSSVPNQEELSVEVDSSSSVKSNSAASSKDSFSDANRLPSIMENIGVCEDNSPSSSVLCQENTSSENGGEILSIINSDIFLYLITTAVSVVIFLFGYIMFDKGRKEGPLVAKINKLEKELLIAFKENEILSERRSSSVSLNRDDLVSNEIVDDLKQQLKEAESSNNLLEEQIQSLEKELENSTEMGMELNRMLTELLNSQNGNENLKSTVELLQKQVIEQQTTINSVNKALKITNTENHELKLEIELNNKKIVDLQKELDKMCMNILKIEGEKEQQQSTLESQVNKYRELYEKVNLHLKKQENEFENEVNDLKNQLSQVERSLQFKNEEFNVVTKTINEFKSNDVNKKSILEYGEIRAELTVVQSENQKFMQRLREEQAAKVTLEKKVQILIQEMQQIETKYNEADKLKVETLTKLDVLSNYFKEREAQLQREINKHESMWQERKGESTSASEQIKFLQDELKNYKAQTEALKQEIISQEVNLKSQISMLEKKAHDSWINTRQVERKLDDINQEAAQLRHRLILSEKNLQEEREKYRMQSPMNQTGEGVVTSLNADTSPLLFGGRDITKSPPVPSLPHFLPPPPGMPFIPPPFHHGVPPFIPPPPSLFPGDHRPPPLGRMSSPPINQRYSPSSRDFYDRSSSPSESEYGTSPTHMRRISSPYNNKSEDNIRDYQRAPYNRSRHNTKGSSSSASGNSRESLEITNQHSKV